MVCPSNNEAKIATIVLESRPSCKRLRTQHKFELINNVIMPFLTNKQKLYPITANIQLPWPLTRSQRNKITFCVPLFAKLFAISPHWRRKRVVLKRGLKNIYLHKSPIIFHKGTANEPVFLYRIKWGATLTHISLGEEFSGCEWKLC